MSGFIAGYASMSAVETLIDKINKIYLADPPTRTGLYMIESYYNTIKNNYRAQITDARFSALTTKINSYQVRLRAVEAGSPFPAIQQPAAIATGLQKTSPTTVTTGNAGWGYDAATDTVSVPYVGTFPARYLKWGAAGMVGLMVLPKILDGGSGTKKRR